MSKSLAKLRRESLAVSKRNKRIAQRQAAAILPLTRPKPTTKSLDRRIKKIQNRQELKHVDVLFNAIEMGSDSTSAAYTLLNPLTIGNTNLTRIGDKASFTSIQIRATITAAAAAIASPVTWRIIVVRDMQPNGATPTPANLLDTSVITALVHAPYNNDYTERFRVISDKKGVINPFRNRAWTDTAGSNVVTEVGRIGIKYNLRWQLGFATNYGLANGGTIADISKNAVFFLAMSDQTLASDLGPTITGGSRMYFKDD